VPEELVPLQTVGRLTLNRNPDNFFAETEQVAFCTANVVPGIDFSNDPLLAGRIHSYHDTQLSRLGGPNFHEIPINAPVVQVHNNQRDGLHRQAIHRGAVAYEPNSLAGGCPFQAGAAHGFMTVPARLRARDEAAKVRAKPELFADHYTQARLFYESQTPPEQAHIVDAFAFELSKVTVPAVRERMVGSLRNASEDLARRVAAKIGMATLPAPLPRAMEPRKPEVARSPALSLMHRPGDGSVAARKVALFVAPAVAWNASCGGLSERLSGQGAVLRVVASTIGPVRSADGQALEADASFANEPGFLFDALVLPDGCEAAANDARALESVRDAYRHCKPILAFGSGIDLLSRAGVPADAKDAGLIVATGDPAAAIDRFVAALGAPRDFSRETDPPRV
jgi:catalase